MWGLVMTVMYRAWIWGIDDVVRRHQGSSVAM